MSRHTLYKISIEDESRLVTLREFHLRKWGMILRLVILLIVMLVLSSLIIALTPLRRWMPGYINEADRDATLENVVRLDSLRDAYNRERAFLDNFLTVINTEREPCDSAKLVANPAPMSVDSLLSASPAEIRFRAGMEDKQAYNVSVLAPLAADGMMFTNVSEEAIITEDSKSSHLAEIILAKGNPVCAIADGSVIDVHYDNNLGGYTILLQHERGFVSRYTRLGTPLVETGDRLNSGQILALQQQGTAKDTSRIGLEMWRNGDAVIPAKILMI
ncbi:MAG: M23 family metallopeptidase [Prevotella sp.]|nr:M23 family metallopeptidase [Bacteroides sp.]MCM1366332.1 M23 family metallopeptidase [Prevotella sp.]MCM1436310.1 M23 family metallopeptidase [Prevotella sp.]